ncbi:MAG: type II toxin-antitoxin system VapC family toxin [Vulcanimicrobiaceae bacterium]
MAGSRIVLDSGALSALAARDGRVVAILRKAIEEKSEIAVPTVVIAESTTGTPRDAPTKAVLRALASVVVPLSEPLARAAGALRYRARRSGADTADAIVVATADASRGSIVLTCDPADMRSLVAVEGKSVVLSVGGR